jgi:hypothetical protein
VTISKLVNRPCTITRRSPSTDTDDYGNAIPDTTTISTVCEIQQQPRRADAETTDDLSDTLWLGIFLPGTDLDASDAVTVDSENYEVSGAPWPARNPRTQTVSHLEANLRRVAAATDS